MLDYGKHTSFAETCIFNQKARREREKERKRERERKRGRGTLKNAYDR